MVHLAKEIEMADTLKFAGRTVEFRGYAVHESTGRAQKRVGRFPGYVAIEVVASPFPREIGQTWKARADCVRIEKAEVAAR